MDRLTHRVHQDLLAQVAGSDEEEREVRRILSEPLKLREADLDAQERFKRAPFAVGKATHAHRYSACASGPCAGGTKLCPSPAACQITAVDPLAYAVEIYIAAKRAEDTARDTRLVAEERILALHPAKEEGADTFEAGGYKVTLTGKLTYACQDAKALAAACAEANVPEEIVPVKTVVELDATGCKWLRANEPEIWAQVISKHVTVKPAKATVKVGV